MQSNKTKSYLGDNSLFCEGVSWPLLIYLLKKKCINCCGVNINFNCFQYGILIIFELHKQ